MDNTPYVSIIIPVRNEEIYISKCLNSILNQDYKKDKLEILIIDGMSEDGTVQKIRDFLGRSENNAINIRVLENLKLIVPCGLNIGIKESKGDYIIRMDAHTEYVSDYISKCIEWLNKTGAENVGGPIISLPGSDSFVAKAICLSLSHIFGVGNSKFRTSQKVEYVDTVTFGAWHKELFDKVGLFDERLARNQDIEFNARIRKNGGKIFLTPGIKSYYHCRSNLKGLWKQNFENGKWVVYTKKIAPYCLSWRHFVPLIFVLSLIISLFLTFFSSLFIILFLIAAGSYILANLFFSALISIKSGIKFFIIMPAVFATLHFSYGLGAIWGLITLRKWVQKNI